RHPDGPSRTSSHGCSRREMQTCRRHHAARLKVPGQQPAPRLPAAVHPRDLNPRVVTRFAPCGEENVLPQRAADLITQVTANQNWKMLIATGCLKPKTERVCYVIFWIRCGFEGISWATM